MARTTIRDVAKRAGVSHVTVANVLNGHAARSSEETKQRVLAAVAELAYVPVAQPATQKRVSATRTIGLVFDDVDLQEGGFGLATYHGLCLGAQEHGYDLLTVLKHGPQWARAREETRFLDRRCDGYIFVGPYQNPAVLRALLQHRVPVVACFNRDVPAGIASVQPDDAAAMHLAVDHLVQLGHRRIAHLAGPINHSDARLRREGFEAAMKQHGLAPTVVTHSRPDQWCGADEYRTLCHLDISAAVAINDSQALSLMSCARHHGWQLPAVVGVDDIPAAREAGLTSISFSSSAIGRAAIDLLESLITGQSSIECRVVPVQLIARASTLSSTGPALPPTAARSRRAARQTL